MSNIRQIVLDTETTGLDPAQGHRLIEIGCIELVNRRLSGRRLHYYLQPDREIDAAAQAVHGISNEFLRDKPRFAEIVDEFLAFIEGAELIIHNASFDLNFINHELTWLNRGLPAIEQRCSVVDTLLMARALHPGQRNSLDALCKRYEIDNSQRTLHGALLDAQILSEVYLAMTGGQVTLLLDEQRHPGADQANPSGVRRVSRERPALKVLLADEQECAAHQQRLAQIERSSGGQCLWLVQSDHA